MSVKPDYTRSPEELTLMNPPFIAAILYFSAQGYEEETGGGMPFSLAFLVPPLVLVKDSRTSMPSRKDSSLAAWLQKHPEVRLRFPTVASALVPVVREGLLFGVNRGAMAVDGAAIKLQAKLVRGSGKIVTTNTGEFQDVLKKARFAGRWFSNAGSIQTIFALWGIRP